jgi:hypothetical protein
MEAAQKKGRLLDGSTYEHRPVKAAFQEVIFRRANLQDTQLHVACDESSAQNTKLMDVHIRLRHRLRGDPFCMHRF